VSQKTVPRRDIPDRMRIRPGARTKLLDSEADRCFGWEKEKAMAATAENLIRLEELQYKMYADKRFAMLTVLQAIDGGGKDSTIRRVFGAFNPQGCTVTAFKAPSAEDLRHDYLWRIHRHAPPRGEIAVFNRSHYEDVLIVRVNDLVPEDVWSRRYEQINEFERLLDACNTRVVKIFLQISKEEQRDRFQERLTDRRKNWKFDTGDLEKRQQWTDYTRAIEAMFARCSTEHAPCYVVPANRKRFREYAVAQLLIYVLVQNPYRFTAPNIDTKTIKRL
jgi:PPK2 family polyphosphate:nucleotide phosphotransferase